MAKNSGKFLFVADHPCLDFLNTRMVQKGLLVDTLETFEDFLQWIQESSLTYLSDATFRRLKKHRDASHVLEQARKFREALREMVLKLIEGKRVSEDVIQQINHYLSFGAARSLLLRKQNGFEKKTEDRIENPEDLLAPIAETAANLLCYADYSMIRKCENDRCVLHFYDITRNHARRWCSMSACGNRHKAATHYKKIKNKKV